MLLMVSPEYFYRKNGLYLIRDEWLRLWQESMRDNSITQVDIRRVDDKGEGKFESIVAEVAKYATKPLSYILKNEKGEFEADPKVVETLHYALKKRRTFAFSGYFKKVWKEKKLQNIEKLDLVSVDEEEIDEDGVVKEKTPECCKVCNEPLVKEAYRWDRVAKEYLRVYSDGDNGYESLQSGLKTIQCRGPS
jgi:plasmid rolling circle replication initiator protein Rep